MAQSKLSLATIGQLDMGRAEAIIDNAIGRAVMDTEDRGQDGKSRKVTIVLEMKLADATGRIAVDVQAGVTVPSHRTSPTIGQAKMTGPERLGLFFQEMSPGNPDQETMNFEESA